MLANNNRSSINYLYKVCRDHPLLVISTPHGIGKYHFNCIGYKNSQLLLEFTLIIDHNFKDSDTISTIVSSSTSAVEHDNNIRDITNKIDFLISQY